MIDISLAPWLTVSDGSRAAEFYTAAFGAIETYRLEAPDGALILRFSVGSAEFWISGGPSANGGAKSSGEPAKSGSPAVSEGAKASDSPTASAAKAAPPSEKPLGADTIRMILTVPDPDTIFARALAAGASEVFPVGEGHGWRLGRLIDPFGLHWEIGHPLG